MIDRKKLIVSFILCVMISLTGCKSDESDLRPNNETERDQETVSGAETGEPWEESADLYGLNPISYDLSALPAMKNRLYALWEGNVYFRQYSDADLADGGQWADFLPSASTEKALLCMKPDGEVVRVGTDYGCGALLIAAGRLYSQRCLSEEEYVVYSCALDGSDVKDYGSAEILAERTGRIICRTAASGLSYIDSQTGQEHILADGDAWYLDATEEEIFFYGYQDNQETGTRELTLYSVDYEGDIHVLRMITREEYLDYMGEDTLYGYPMDIPYFCILEDRLYFSAGSYNGNAHMYSGGPVYSMKKDGSDCRVEVRSANAYFYLYDDGHNRVLYYQADSFSRLNEEDTGMRQVLLDGEAPRDVTIPPPYAAYDEPYVEGGTNSVLFYPDTSGVCYVLLTAQESETLGITTHADGSWAQKINEIEYVGGRLFFTVTDLTYNREKSIGWRDYYDRGRSVCYCKELGSGEIRRIYEY